MNSKYKIDILKSNLKKLYEQHNRKLLFHGWHHIIFVTQKALEFAEMIGANSFLVESAALTHDLNFIVKVNSEPDVGTALRRRYLIEARYSPEEIEAIERIIMESHTASRSRQISNEGKALSDADTLFKSLPITPVIFASKYISENKIDLYTLATKIISEQHKLMEGDIYFYTEFVKEKYLGWAKVNLDLWEGIIEALQDESVKELLRIAQANGVISYL